MATMSTKPAQEGPKDDINRTQVSTMKEMWKDVEVRFKNLTGKQLNSKPMKTLNDVIAKIEKCHHPGHASSSDKASGVSKAKDYGRNILHCLKLLGGVAAQGLEKVRLPRHSIYATNET
jgi:hypothetical protein